MGIVGKVKFVDFSAGNIQQWNWLECLAPTGSTERRQGSLFRLCLVRSVFPCPVRDWDSSFFFLRHMMRLRLPGNWETNNR